MYATMTTAAPTIDPTSAAPLDLAEAIRAAASVSRQASAARDTMHRLAEDVARTPTTEGTSARADLVAADLDRLTCWAWHLDTNARAALDRADSARDLDTATEAAQAAAYLLASARALAELARATAGGLVALGDDLAAQGTEAIRQAEAEAEGQGIDPWPLALVEYAHQLDRLGGDVAALGTDAQAVAIYAAIWAEDDTPAERRTYARQCLARALA